MLIFKLDLSLELNKQYNRITTETIFVPEMILAYNHSLVDALVIVPARSRIGCSRRSCDLKRVVALGQIPCVLVYSSYVAIDQSSSSLSLYFHSGLSGEQKYKLPRPCPLGLAEKTNQRFPHRPTFACLRCRRSWQSLPELHFEFLRPWFKE